MDAMERPEVRQGVSRDTLSISEARSTGHLQRILPMLKTPKR
jgi:hypothetical protein